MKLLTKLACLVAFSATTLAASLAHADAAVDFESLNVFPKKGFKALGGKWYSKLVIRNSGDEPLNGYVVRWYLEHIDTSNQYHMIGSKEVSTTFSSPLAPGKTKKAAWKGQSDGIDGFPASSSEWIPSSEGQYFLTTCLAKTQAEILAWDNCNTTVFNIGPTSATQPNGEGFLSFLKTSSKAGEVGTQKNLSISIFNIGQQNLPRVSVALDVFNSSNQIIFSTSAMSTRGISAGKAGKAGFSFTPVTSGNFAIRACVDAPSHSCILTPFSAR
ncbi:MAG TPA: hypothetical protein VEB21_14610 [Terriglobales bacterium]|nr:hypothetical protein [Terriglobales bacterium]